MHAENLYGQWVCTHCPNGSTVQKRALVNSRSGRTSRPGDPRPNPQGAGADRPYLLLSNQEEDTNCTLRRETYEERHARLLCGMRSLRSDQPRARTVYRAVGVYPTVRTTTIERYDWR